MRGKIADNIHTLRNELRRRIGSEKYDSWFSKSDFRIEEGLLKVVAPNTFVSGLLKRNFQSDIDLCVRELSDSQLSVQFEVASGKTDKTPPAKRRMMPVAPVVVEDTNAPSRNKSGKQTYKHTLDSFIVGKKNNMAFNAAKMVADNPGKNYNPLFFYGTYGIGKTHLLQAICNQAAKNQVGANCVYVSAEEFTNEYLNAIKSGGTEKFRKKYRNVDILAIDDIHFLANKKATQEEFLHTFNSIDLADKQLVLASDSHPTMIAKLADNLVNRFVSGMVVQIEAPDFETRIKICEQKIKEMNVIIDREIIEYVAHNITNSVRDLEGALLKLNAHIMLTGEKLSPAIAQYLLGNSVKSSAPLITPESVLACTTAFFSITTQDIKSSRKDRTISLARAVAMYILREKTDMSLPEIGREFGGKNHATVILACKKIKSLIEKDIQAQWKVQGLSRRENINTVIRQLTDSIGC